MSNARATRRLYRALLALYPADFRRAYADEQARLFADLCRDAAGRRDLAALWVTAAADLVMAVAREHLAHISEALSRWNMDRRTWLVIGLALLMGLWLGYIDQKTVEVQGTLLFLLPFGFVLGAFKPERAWRWALILGLSIPIAGLITRYLGLEPAGLTHSREVTGLPLPFTYTQALTGIIALIPAFIAVYGGVVAREAFFNRLWRLTQ